MNPPPLANEPAGPDQSRLLVAIILSTGLIFAWNMIFPPEVPPPQSADAGQLDEKPSDGTPVAETTKPAGTPDGTPPANGPAPEGTAPVDPDAPPVDPAVGEQLAAQSGPEQTHRVEKKVEGASGVKSKAVIGGFVAELSTVGGQFTKWELPGYGDTARGEVDKTTGEMVYPRVDLAQTQYPFGLRQFALASAESGGDVALRFDDSYALSEKSDSGASFTRLTESGVEVTRKYTFEDGRFGFRHDLILENKSDKPRTANFALVATAATARDGKKQGFFASMGARDPIAAGCSVAGDRESFDVADFNDLEEKKEVKGPLEHAAASLQYFTAAILPVDANTTLGCRADGFWFENELATKKKEDKGNTDGAIVIVELKPITLGPGETKTVSQLGFFGPNQLQLLQAEGHNMQENIEFGMFGVLSRPILAVLVWLNDYTGNFGFAIILLTLLIKLLTFPLTQKSYTSMQQMKTFQPLMKELQEKYKHDRALLGQKQMEMYKEKGINPLAGCFPMLIQMPIWFALYRTLWTSVELYQQPFFGWINDLSQPDLLPLIGFGVLPFGVGLLMLIQTSMSPPPQEQPQMKYVLWAMPIMFTFFMFQMPSGLSVYMITNSSLTLVQQWFIKRKFKDVDLKSSTGNPDKDKAASQKKSGGGKGKGKK